MGAIAKYKRNERGRADLPGGGRADAPGISNRADAPETAPNTDKKTRLKNQLNRLNDLRETAVALRTEKRGIPGAILLELIIILPDVIEDLLHLNKYTETAQK